MGDIYVVGNKKPIGYVDERGYTHKYPETIFDPKPDITVLELALIVKNLLLLENVTGIPDELKRHFAEVKGENGS
jgi:hypothetical protein